MRQERLHEELHRTPAGGGGGSLSARRIQSFSELLRLDGKTFTCCSMGGRMLSGQAAFCHESACGSTNANGPGYLRGRSDGYIAATGLEHPSNSPEKQGFPAQGGAESGALGGESATNQQPADPDLAAVVSAWANLPAAIRAGIVAMVKTAAR